MNNKKNALDIIEEGRLGEVVAENSLEVLSMIRSTSSADEINTWSKWQIKKVMTKKYCEMIEAEMDEKIRRVKEGARIQTNVEVTALNFAARTAIMNLENDYVKLT